MRKVAQLGSVALVVLALSACGGSGDEAAQTSESTPAGAQTSVAEKPSEQPVVTPVPETEAVPASEAAVTSDTTANDPATSSEEVPAQEDAAEEADRGYAMRRRLMDSTVGADEWSPDLTGAPLVDVEATLQRATDALRAGRLEDAARTFSNSVELNDRLLVAFVGLSLAQCGNGQTADAMESLNLAAGLVPNSVLLLT